jgi:hypothetical protein
VDIGLFGPENFTLLQGGRNALWCDVYWHRPKLLELVTIPECFPTVGVEAAFLCTSTSKIIRKPTATIQLWNNVDGQPLLSLPKPRAFSLLASRRGLGGTTEIINQEIDTYQEHPEREDHYNPLNIAPAKQEK